MRQCLSLTVRARVAVATLLSVLVTITASVAQTDQVGQANATYTSVPDARRSDLVLLPAIAAMDEPPVGLEGEYAAVLLGPSSSLWADVAEWAQSPNQQAALEALRQVTQSNDLRRGMEFAQPYGLSGVDPAMIKAKLYTPLGDPPLLAGARFLYLDGLDQLADLINVEATRLAAAGKPGEAIDLLVRQVYLGRQIADRAFFKEISFGLNLMIQGFERIRDVAYTDYRGDQQLSPSDIERTISALQIYNSYLDPSRLRFPSANKLAAQQLWELLYEPRGGIKSSFANTMARLRTADRPLRLFAEASRYESAGDTQADWFEVRDAIDAVFDSWSARWTLAPFDRQLSLPYAWDTLDHPRFQVITASTSDLSVLYTLRRVFETEAVGTRQALAILGQYDERGEWPPTASSVRPRWLSSIEADPFNPNRANGRKPPLEFFVPVRDDYVASEQQTKKPHQMNVFAPGGTNFSIMLGEDQFILYSVGRDGAKNFADDVSINPDAVTGDYLIWPPMYALYREHLRETNQLP